MFHRQPLFDLNLSEDAIADRSTMQTLLSKARMNIQLLIVSSQEGSTIVQKKSFFALRMQTTALLQQLRQLLATERLSHQAVSECLRPMAGYFEHFSALPIVDVMHSIGHQHGSQSTSPVHHLLHGHLEWRWLHLTIVLRVQLDRNATAGLMQTLSLRDTEFELRLKLLLFDLMLAAAAKFNKVFGWWKLHELRNDFNLISASGRRVANEEPISMRLCSRNLAAGAVAR